MTGITYHSRYTGQLKPTPPPEPQPTAPPAVITDSKYVPYPEPSKELAALKTAMDEIVKRYPGSKDTIETLTNWKGQLMAGQKPLAKEN